MSKKPPSFITTTGAAAEYLPPAGQARDDLLALVRVGLAFRTQHAGKRPEFLQGYLNKIVATMTEPTFAHLLLELVVQARRRELLGTSTSPIEKVDREFDVLTWHHPRRGRQQIAFGTLKNKFTRAKAAAFPASAKR